MAIAKLFSGRRKARGALGTIVFSALLLAAYQSGALGQQTSPTASPPFPPPVYAPMAAEPGGPIAPRPTGYKVDAIEFLLIPSQAVEYKYTLEEGATMLYSWEATGQVRFDFHTIPDGKPLSASDRFQAAETEQAHGVYVAPYPGLHGWWWENTSQETVTIRVTTAGFYTSATMFSDGEQYPFDVADPPPPLEP